jgi:hypothetical protein
MVLETNLQRARVDLIGQPHSVELALAPGLAFAQDSDATTSRGVVL